MQVKEYSRAKGVALVVNLAQVMTNLQRVVSKLPPCREEMEVCSLSALVVVISFSICKHEEHGEHCYHDTGLFIYPVSSQHRPINQGSYAASEHEYISGMYSACLAWQCLQAAAPPGANHSALAPVQVSYIYQADRSVIGTMPVWHDDAYMQELLAAQLSIFVGEKAPEKVPVADDWKCSYCLFLHACGGPPRMRQ